jgi:phospholipid/cholesterol/gamma-HCH transport system ATP-binding protein
MPNITENPVLEMDNVRISELNDPDKIVLENVQWKALAGEYWVIGGLHASGKSSFFSVAAGILPPAAGSYRVFGTELGAGYEHETISVRLRIGTIFDGGRLLHHLSVAENITLPLRYHENLTLEETLFKVEPLLEFIGMSGQAGGLPGNISRNWRQRAGLARALILKPDVLIFDTPLTGLDPRDAGWWLDTMEQLSAGHPLLDNKHLTIVVTADDLRPWRERAGNFAILRERRLVPLGNRAEFKARPLEEVL